MIVVHCPRCGCTDWRSEQEYHLDLFMWGYACVKCGTWMSDLHYQQLADIERQAKGLDVIMPALKRVVEMFDGEDSQ